jgi:DNA-binding response OmpR family regulator
MAGRQPARCVAWRRILVADTDPAIGRLLARFLPAEGFRAEPAHTASAILAATEDDRPDIVVIGSDLADMTCLDLVRALHLLSGPPRLVLVPQGGDAVALLDAGADDCLAKPFLLGELAARLRRLVRRDLAERGLPPVIRAGGLEIDCVRWHIRRGGNEVVLSAHEHAALCLLLEQAGTVVSARAILRRVWGMTDGGAAGAGGRIGRVRRLVAALRRKLGGTPQESLRIQAEQQEGYRLTLPRPVRVGETEHERH